MDTRVASEPCLREDLEWRRYCGLLDLTLEEWQALQEECLQEQLELLSSVPWSRRLLGGRRLSGPEDLRARMPLTTYADYAPFLSERKEDLLPAKPACWAYTSTSRGYGKWVPYTAQAVERLGDALMGAIILAAAGKKGEVNINRGEWAIYNVAPRPYLAGYMALVLRDRFGFRSIPPLEEAERMEFHQRVERAFTMALRTGVDMICSLSSVLLRMGERFTHRAKRNNLPWWDLLHPRVLARLVTAKARSRLGGHPILPKDLWHPKALLAWGMDTALFKEKIAYYWGRLPYQFYACTEAGILALQGWNKKGLTFLPSSAYLEFLPEEEAGHLREDPEYTPVTVLLHQVQPGQRYEVVLTSLLGMPFLRYRTGHLIKVLGREDPGAGVGLPQVVQVGRSDELIDLAGFTRLDENTLWEAIVRITGSPTEWVACREAEDSTPILHLYLERAGEGRAEEWAEALHYHLQEVDAPYRDMAMMLGLYPVRVTFLTPGTFRAYQAEALADQKDPFQARVPRVNPSPRVVEALLRTSARLNGSQGPGVPRGG